MKLSSSEAIELASSKQALRKLQAVPSGRFARLAPSFAFRQTRGRPLHWAGRPGAIWGSGNAAIGYRLRGRSRRRDGYRYGASESTSHKKVNSGGGTKLVQFACIACKSMIYK